MSRRFPRVRARFTATVQVGGSDHTLICQTRDISREGCFLQTAETIATGVTVFLSVMDNERSEVVSVQGIVTRCVPGPDSGVGILLVDPSEDWLALVDRFESNMQSVTDAGVRLRVVVVSSAENRRGALALYVSSGWDIRFATDLDSAREAMDGPLADAVICECDVDDPLWEQICKLAKTDQPSARRLVRSRLFDDVVATSGPHELVHRFVEVDSGMDALLDALTATIDIEDAVLQEPVKPPPLPKVPLPGLRDSKTPPPHPVGKIPLIKPIANRSVQVSFPEVLQAVLRNLEQGEKSIAAFDLDSTLLNNAPRQSKILQEYGEEKGIEVLKNSKPKHWKSWDVGEAMSNAGLDDAGVEKHRDAFKEYWRERFFTSKYCRIDEMIDGACDFVQAVRDTHAKVYYVTGRHEEMREGTVECLQRLGFPVPDDRNVFLLMKPTLEEDDDIFKQGAYEALRQAGSVVAAFDNEPTHINGYRTAFPDAMAIHLETDHSGRPVEILEGVVSISAFVA